ncbi:MAG: helix-turn-helix domain-containing protein [Nanoarchaeota archaeon]
MECSICGIEQSENMLLDAISSKEIIKVCELCAVKENLPILKRPTTSQLKEAEKIVPYYKRVGDTRNKKVVSDKIETTLRQIVDRNYEKNIQAEKKPRPDLVDNFHWVIMRERRMKKITQEQLAKEISESEAAIKMAENGILPDDSYKLVKKLESFLGINIIKSEIRKTISEEPQKQPARILKFDPATVQNFTISDLKRIKDEREKNSSTRGQIKETQFEPEFGDADLEEPINLEDFNEKALDEE